MSDVLRSRLALRIAVGAAAVALASVLLFAGGSSPTIQAEFTDARGLLVGNSVRINGASVGSVSGISLTRRGTALVTMSLNAQAPLPRVDAAASIRPVDLLGDIYVSYSPGAARAFLHGPIPLSRTENVPRLADLLQAFTPGARAGAQALIVNLGLGLEQRGFDLSRAAVALRPALQATDQVVAEMASQNADLQSLIANSDDLTRQLAQHNPGLDASVTRFARTLSVTAAHAASLNRGLVPLAPTVRALSQTTGELTTTAHALEPLATQLGAVAPPLEATFTRLPSFLARARTAITATRPTLRAATAFLERGSTAFPALTAGLTAGQSGASPTNDLLTTLVQLTPLISQALFNNVAGETSEPGNEPFDEEDPLRNYWRGAAVLSCQSFGLPITPGCLQGYLNSSAATDRAARGRSAAPPRTAPRAAAKPPADRSAGAGAPSVAVGPTAPPRSPTGSAQPVGATGRSGPGPGMLGSALGSLLKYLLSR